MILGCASAIFWATTSSLLTTLAFIYAQMNGVQADSVNQRFFAIFYAGYHSSQITGNLISSFILSKGIHFFNTLSDKIISRTKMP